MVNFPDPAYSAYQAARRENWEKTNFEFKSRKGFGKYYHRRLQSIYKRLIPPGKRVLELGCGRGDLLHAVNPSFGVGIDFSRCVLEEAHKKYSNLDFIQADAHELICGAAPFDYLILSDVLNDLWDAQWVFESIKRMAGPGTRIVINTYSRLWELPLAIVKRLHLAHPVLRQNWFTIPDVKNLLHIAGFETISTWREILTPIYIPGIAEFLNKFLVKFPLFEHLGLTNFILARPLMQRKVAQATPSVSVVIPARNEAGNIEDIFRSMPSIGKKMELVFVEGHSTDHTAQAIRKSIKSHPEFNCKLIHQTNKGKGDAVRLGFDKAGGDILMILDADLSVQPADLPKFYNVLVSGQAEFVNGVRLVYPMEKQAMRYFNLLGNKFFSLVFSWLLGQSVKDTLCGTKVLWKEDYQKIAAARSYFGNFDPFGDFDLLFGAARLGLKILDMPIRYRERKYGTTNIQRWKHGFLLLRMASFAAWRIKLV